MKILWVEDFGQTIAPSTLIENVFGDLLKGIDHDRDYTEIGTQLSDLFAKHTLHEIYVCRSYLEWKEIDEQHGDDFDIALIDINLESYKTPKRDWPRGVRGDFNRRAGFYIYHQLIKKGFPDDNIAFFTAEGHSLKEFEEYCGDILLDRPAHCFEKRDVFFEPLRSWLTEKETDESLILRRGVIEGCRFMKERIAALNGAEVPSQLIFYKTIPGMLKEGPEALKRDAIEYLTRVERVFFMRSNNDSSELGRAFILELAAKWEESLGEFVRAKEAPQFGSWLDSQFYRAVQMQMKTLRNWANHRQLSLNLTPRDLAYFFLLAMRGFVETDLGAVLKYEQILLTLFEHMSDLEFERRLNSGFEFRLEHSYQRLKALHKEVIGHIDESSKEKMRPRRPDRRLENYFLEMFRETGDAARWLKLDSRKYYLSRMREESVPLFYQSFWHGLFPMEIPTTYYADLERTKFNVKPIPQSFISALGRAILEDAFRDADVTASAA
jgi:hypothetical protein